MGYCYVVVVIVVVVCLSYRCLQRCLLFRRPDAKPKDLPKLLATVGIKNISHFKKTKNPLFIFPLFPFNFCFYYYSFLQSLKRAIEREKEVIAEVVRRVLDNRLVCRDTETDWGAKANEMIKGLTTHYVHCGPNELLQKFFLKRKSGSNKSQTRYKYRCCRLNMKDKWQRPSDL